MITNIISHPIGLYVLTADGDLGYFSENQEFQIDRETTAALKTRELNFTLLREQLAQRDPERSRVAVIGCPNGPRAWGEISLFLEESVVRELYPVTGIVAAGLTAFQRKNQEKSVYRGMELLLEYRRLQYPDAPVYCPVLFDRGLMLDSYPGIAGCVAPENAHTPAVDVLNLVSVVPAAWRDITALNRIKAKVHGTLIHKERRRGVPFEVSHGSYQTAVRVSLPEKASVGGDHRGQRAGVLTEQDLGELRLAQRLAPSPHWQKVAAPQKAAQTLRAFHHFRDLSPEGLGLIASQALLFTATPGTQLLQQGTSTPWTLYLLEGQVQLASHDHMTVMVEAGSMAAKSAIAFLKPRKYTVTALSHVRFWWVHDIVLRCAGVGI